MSDTLFQSTRDEAIALLEQALTLLGDSPAGTGMSPDSELNYLARLNTATDRLNARRSLEIADADKRRVAETATGLTMAVWLKATRRATKRSWIR